MASLISKLMKRMKSGGSDIIDTRLQQREGINLKSNLCSLIGN